jgi:hypothetical protein
MALLLGMAELDMKVKRQFTWDKVADSTIDVYADVVANGRKY